MGYWEKILELHKINYTNENLRYLQYDYRFVHKDMDIILKKKYQSGGAKIKYKDFNVVLNGTEDKDSIIYSFNNESECLLIDISKITKDIAVITGISADYGCYDENKKKMKGSDLLDLAIYFIETRKKFKTKDNKILEIKKIQLTDNSHISCNGVKVKLSNLYTLLNGYTWYMNRGFIPYGTYDIETNRLINLMYKNKNIINNLTIDKSKILDYILTIKKTNINKDAIGNLINFINKNKNNPLKDLFKLIKKDFHKYCNIILHLTEEFYHNIGLQSFYKHTFILKI